MFKASADKGGFTIKSADEGTYAVTVELPGYKTATATISVISGLMGTLEVALERA